MALPVGNPPSIPGAEPIPPAAGHAQDPTRTSDLLKVSLGALGVVYGDIGTSPLYAIQQCFERQHGVPVTPDNVLGILSLVFWALTLVIVVKYIGFIMSADNHGEGGILALLALVTPGRRPGSADSTNSAESGMRTRHPAMRAALITLGLFGAALLYGDGMITPAISVLSAVEGLKVATPFFDPAVVPITIGVLLILFAVQRRGTAGIGAVFGPTMLVWFFGIAACGVPWIIRRPEVLMAVNPYYGALFFVQHGWHGFLVLGAVVLCITGGEALYADMGHFGKRPIRIAWYGGVFPALLCNYFGQGALLLHHAMSNTLATPAGVRAAENPFYGLVPEALLYPMVVLATVATVVASQALISGAFSLTRQAVQLGYSPRVTIIHTSGTAEGQIFVPEINTMLMVACIGLVLAFRESAGLAAAYGIAVTGTMAITSLLFYAVARERWGWSRLRAGSLLLLFLSFDMAFFSANAAKIAHGGWVPVVVAGMIFTVMVTWRSGRAAMERFVLSASLPIEGFLEDLERRAPHRVRGTAVFMTSNLHGVPVVLLHHFKHNKVLHEQVVLLSVISEREPEVPASRRVSVKELSGGFFQVTAHYGFMQTPNVPEIMKNCRMAGLKAQAADTSYFLGRETLLITGRSKLARWRKTLFAFLSRNAQPATAFFGIPPNRVVELGAQIEI